MQTTLREKLTRGDTCLGVGLMYPNPNCIESMAKGWDWLWLDGQHGQCAYADILRAVQIAELVGLHTVVRVPGHEPGPIGLVLDTNAEGLMVPMVNTPDEARALVRAACFPPLGSRSYGGRRVIDVAGPEYCLTANDRLVLIAQIETLEAVANAAQIAAVEGIDVLFFGPDDMKMRMGIPINTPMEESSQLLQAMAQTADAALKAGKVPGCVSATPASIRRAADMGYRLIAGGADVGFLKTASAATLTKLRAALDPSAHSSASESKNIY